MSPIVLLGFSWNKLFWIFPLDHAKIRPKSYLRRKARYSATSPQQFLLQHYSQGRRTKCSVDSEKEKQRWSLVTPNNKLLLAPPIIFVRLLMQKWLKAWAQFLNFIARCTVRSRALWRRMTLPASRYAAIDRECAWNATRNRPWWQR